MPSCIRSRLQFRLVGIAVALAAAAALQPAAATAAGEPVVTIDTGAVRGLDAPGYRVYYDIPYAAPPVGDRRFRAPAPAASWAGVRDASATTRPRCPQDGTIAERSRNEDCLYLNVYTPPSASAGDHLPVIVWVHGGSYVAGAKDDFPAEDYSPAVGAIVVTINYRLGPLGLLALPSLSAEDPSLNWGMQDQQAALRWVQRNAEAFGGDTHRVTYAGQSAGAVSACSQLVSPPAAGLFQRVIMESGACDVPVFSPTLSWAYANSKAYVAKVGCPDGPNQLECLRSKSSDELLAATPLSTDFGHPPEFTWGGAVAGTPLVPAEPRKLLAAGRFRHVPVLLGSNKDEGRLLELLAFEAVTGKAPTDADYKTSFTKLFGPAVATVLRALYPTAKYGSAANAISAFYTDMFFDYSTQHTADLLSTKTPLYAYEFDDPNAPNALNLPGVKCSCHASELLSLLRPDGTQLTPPQQALAHQMLRYWGNFASTGNPNGAGLPQWTRYNGVTAQYRHLQLGGLPGMLSPWQYATSHQYALWTLLAPILRGGKL